MLFMQLSSHEVAHFTTFIISRQPRHAHKNYHKNSEACKVTESEGHASSQAVSAYFRYLAYMLDYTTSVFFPFLLLNAVLIATKKSLGMI